MKRKWKQGMAAAGFLLPSLTGVTYFYLIPFADVVRRSFTTAVTGKFAGLENYRTVFQNEAFLLAVKNTARFAFCCLPVLIVSGLLIALLITEGNFGKGFQTCYLLPMAVPAATVVLVWQILFDRAGLLNSALSRVMSVLAGKKTVVSIDYMETDAAFWVLAASYVWKNLGYTVTLWAAGLLGLPGHLKEAAQTDGAGKRQVFFRIVLPQLKPTLYTITVLSFLNSFKAFREAYLAAGAYPHESIYLLQHLFNNWYADLELDKMAAAAVATGGVLLLAILLWQRLWEGSRE